MQQQYDPVAADEIPSVSDLGVGESGLLELDTLNVKSIHEEANDGGHSYQTFLLNCTFTGIWFLFSMALSLYNKNLLGRDLYNFNYPFLVVSMHSLCQFTLSATLMFTFPRKFQPASKPTTYSYITRVAPTAICTALDISFSNASLHYISLSFYTMIKSSTPVWVLVFAFLFGLEKPQWKLVLVILVICSGVVFTVAGEIRFSLIGFLLILSASVMSGLRWSLTQILLQNANMGMDNPVATLRYLSPVGAVLIGLMSCFSEFTGPQGLLQSNFFSTVGSSLQTLAILMAGALLAFCMTLAEYYLIRNTSVVTLSVIGISKEICIISLSVLIFGDLITPIAFLGIVITIGGIAAYHRLKTHDHGHIHVHRSDIIPLSTAIEFERSE